MPHLHLPAAHSDADLALAADVAAAVGSQDLYVTWSHAEGAGAVPEVEAVMREHVPPVNPLTEVLAAVAHGIASLWAAIFRGPEPRHPLPAPRQDEAPERATGEAAA